MTAARVNHLPANRNGRNMEISRLIGRCLRSIVTLANLGEQSIYIDCDVLQADGGSIEYSAVSQPVLLPLR